MIRFGIIHPSKLTPEEYLLLEESVKKDYTGISIDKILDLAYNNLCRIWRGSDTDGGMLIAVTQIIRHGEVDELFIWHLAGTHNNIFRIKDYVQACFENYGHAMGCSRIATESDAQMARFLLTMRYEPTHQRMVKEI